MEAPIVVSAMVPCSHVHLGRERFSSELQHREAVLDQRQGSPSTCILPSIAEAAPLFVPSLAEEDKDKLGQQQSSEAEALLHLAPAAFASEILPPHCRQGQRPR